MYVYESHWNTESECWWPFEPPTEDAFRFKSEEKARVWLEAWQKRAIDDGCARWGHGE